MGKSSAIILLGVWSCLRTSLRQLQAAFFMLVLVFSLAACGSGSNRLDSNTNEPTADTNTSSSPEPTVSASEGTSALTAENSVSIIHSAADEGGTVSAGNSASTEYSDPAESNISIEINFATDKFLSGYESFNEYLEVEDEGYQKIVITADKPLKDFRFITIEFGDSNEDITYFDTGTLYALDELLPEKPFVVTWMSQGLMPYRGITFTDKDGTSKYFYISQSGEDGSLLLVEFQLKASADSQSPAPIPTAEPSDFIPTDISLPEIPDEEFVYIPTPNLVRLEPYKDGSYTDGSNIFIFKDDGTVYFNYYGGSFFIEKRELNAEPSLHEIMQTDEYKAVCEKAYELTGIWPGQFSLVYKDGGDYYLYDAPIGGGSGGAYSVPGEAAFFRVNIDGDYSDYGALGAAHIVYYEGYFYYVEYVGDIYFTPGVGKITRMDMDGTNIKTIYDEPVFGTIQVIDGRIYYSSLAEGKAYSVDLNGGDKQSVGDRIAPDYHRIGLDFYGDTIINRYWQDSGYSYGISVSPDDYESPAIMDSRGYVLLTFPAELCGIDPYTVINYGGSNGNGFSFGGKFFLFLKSNIDASYWVYSKEYDDDSYVPDLYSMAWDEYVRLYE